MLIKLRPKVFDVLIYLIAHRDRVISRAAPEIDLPNRFVSNDGETAEVPQKTPHARVRWGERRGCKPWSVIVWLGLKATYLCSFCSVRREGFAMGSAVRWCMLQSVLGRR
jgi:hypothetical protein